MKIYKNCSGYYFLYHICAELLLR